MSNQKALTNFALSSVAFHALEETRAMARRLPSFRWLIVHGACDDQASASSSYLHANLGGTDDWPIKFTGTERHTPELCRLLNELQGEMERGGHRPGRFKFTALTESGNKQILSKQPQGRDRAVFHQLQQNAAGVFKPTARRGAAEVMKLVKGSTAKVAKKRR